MTNPSGFGAAGGAARVYGLGAGGLGALPLAPPGGLSLRDGQPAAASGLCGTVFPAWLSAWAGPHATGGLFDDDGGPPGGFAEGMPAGRLPAPGDPALRATACFRAGTGYECEYHAAVEVAACGGGRLAWRLPPAPSCFAGYCAAAPPAGAAGGGR